MKSFKCLLLLLLPISLFAQQSAEILYAEGELFSIIDVEGNRRSYEPYYDDVLGLTIQVGETILTEEETFLEITFSNTRTILKISENTTFRIEALTEGGGGVIEVAYGRIRARVEKVSQEQDFWVTGYDTVAGIRGTDFGYDLFFDPLQQEGAKTTSVYCFEGEVEVRQEIEDPADLTGEDKRYYNKEPLFIQSNEMVITHSGTPGAPLVKQPLMLELDSFWEEHDFVTSQDSLPPLPSDVYIAQGEPESQSPEEDSSDPLVLLPEEESLVIPEDPIREMSPEQQKMQRSGAIIISMGVCSIAGGLISYTVDPDKNKYIAQYFGFVGGGLVATGTGMSLYSLSMDDR